MVLSVPKVEGKKKIDPGSFFFNAGGPYSKFSNSLCIPDQIRRIHDRTTPYRVIARHDPWTIALRHNSYCGVLQPEKSLVEASRRWSAGIVYFRPGWVSFYSRMSRGIWNPWLGLHFVSIPGILAMDDFKLHVEQICFKYAKLILLKF